jgi:hypothetical protein
MTSPTDGRHQGAAAVPSRRPVLIFAAGLIGIALTFYGIRIATDLPFLVTGTDPEPEDFEARYVAHWRLAYLHMTPGVLYLLGASLQLSQRFRTTHYTFHRRLGRVLVTAAIVSIVFALLFGLRFPWGGDVEPPQQLSSAAGFSSACCWPCVPFGTTGCLPTGVG